MRDMAGGRRRPEKHHGIRPADWLTVGIVNQCLPARKKQGQEKFAKQVHRARHNTRYRRIGAGMKRRGRQALMSRPVRVFFAIFMRCAGMENAPSIRGSLCTKGVGIQSSTRELTTLVRYTQYDTHGCIRVGLRKYLASTWQLVGKQTEPTGPAGGASGSQAGELTGRMGCFWSCQLYVWIYARGRVLPEGQLAGRASNWHHLGLAAPRSMAPPGLTDKAGREAVGLSPRSGPKAGWSLVAAHR